MKKTLFVSLVLMTQTALAAEFYFTTDDLARKIGQLKNKVVKMGKSKQNFCKPAGIINVNPIGQCDHLVKLNKDDSVSLTEYGDIVLKGAAELLATTAARQSDVVKNAQQVSIKVVGAGSEIQDVQKVGTQIKFKLAEGFSYKDTSFAVEGVGSDADFYNVEVTVPLLIKKKIKGQAALVTEQVNASFDFRLGVVREVVKDTDTAAGDKTVATAEGDSEEIETEKVCKLVVANQGACGTVESSVFEGKYAIKESDIITVNLEQGEGENVELIQSVQVAATILNHDANITTKGDDIQMRWGVSPQKAAAIKQQEANKRQQAGFGRQ